MNSSNAASTASSEAGPGDGVGGVPEELEVSDRVQTLHREVLGARHALCTERALVITDFFKHRADPDEPMVLQKARGLAHLLEKKAVRIYPGELLVGCFTSHRVGGGLYPELHSMVVMEDLFRLEKRASNPFVVSPGDRRRLLTRVIPYWLPRFMGLRAFPLPDALRFFAEQLKGARYMINETGGISHFVPDLETLLAGGTTGYRQVATERLEDVSPQSDAADFLRAVIIACDGLDAMAAGFATEAQRQAQETTSAVRRRELEEIASACRRVPKHPARTFQEALQGILFTQIALNMESLDNSVCPGRLDQVLYPFYRDDLEAGRIDERRAFELLGCFAVKLCEILPVFSERLTRIHGGLFNGQALIVGGTDSKGKDATNTLTYLFVQLMDKLRTRQPNYQARLHAGSPAAYRKRVALALANGAASPALYNDEVIVPILRARGVSEGDARDYAAVGCVEPVSVGRSYFSTDAALLNLPLCLELALNEGRQFGKRRRIGARTPPAEQCKGFDAVVALFETQVRYLLGRLIKDLTAIEIANARFHPTPLTSTLLRGCLEAMRDASAGGALYNASGIQGVGVVEVGDSLAALQKVVFDAGKASMSELVAACKDGFAKNPKLRARLLAAPKYGNDEPFADASVARTMKLFAAILPSGENTRGGRYAAGFYSVTTHLAFGEKVGALPSGRLGGKPFSSGLSPAHGADRSGPTAALMSLAGLPFDAAQNGANYNLQLAPWAGAAQSDAVEALTKGAFNAGCMQLQVNVLDPNVLIEARDNPGSHPGLLVRVSGYSAYFDDLTPQVQQEVIDRQFFETDSGPTC